jgi:hypothetical protein
MTRTLLVAALLVVLADISLGAIPPGYRIPGMPRAEPGPRTGTCRDEKKMERELGETWSEWEGRRTCKCVRYDYGLFSVHPGMDKSPKRWCELEGRLHALSQMHVK